MYLYLYIAADPENRLHARVWLAQARPRTVILGVNKTICKIRQEWLFFDESISLEEACPAGYHLHGR